KRRYEMSKKKLKELREDEKKLTVKAEKTGLVVYDTGRSRYGGNDIVVAEGEKINPRQQLLIIPDMSTLQIRTRVYEVMIDQITPGLPAVIRLDSKPDLTLKGKVSKVAVLPDSQNRWLNPGVKVYPATVTFDGDLSKLDLKPGMTCNVEVTLAELDDAISYGPGLRWAIMGTGLIYHMAGGDGGMRHTLEQFGPTLKLPWTKLEAPELTDELIDRLVEGTREQAGGRSVKQLEQLRDNCLIDIMRALQKYEIGAGKVLADAREALDAGRNDEAQRLLIQIVGSPFLPKSEKNWAAKQVVRLSDKPRPTAAPTVGTAEATVVPVPKQPAGAGDADRDRIMRAVAARQEKARKLLAQAKVALDANKPADARTLLQQALGLDPDLEEAQKHLKFAEGLLGIDDEAGALTHLARRTRVARQLNDLEIDKALGRSNEYLARSVKAEDFKAALNGTRIAM
ncbi:hypothetical protein LCGC14_2636120, partial [marine sediment metagenome]